MSPEDIERTTIGNAQAIGELTVIAKQTSKDVDKLITHLDSLPTARIVSLEKRTKDAEEKIKTFIPGATIKWVMSGIATLLLGYVAYDVSIADKHEDEIHKLDKLAGEKIQMQKQINKNVESTLNRHEDFLGMKRTKTIVSSNDTRKW